MAVTLKQEFEEWLVESLEKFSLQDDVYKDYIVGIIEENTSSAKEKAEGVTEFLSAATEQNLDDFQNKVLVWAEKLDDRHKQDLQQARAIELQKTSSTSTTTNRNERRKRNKASATFQRREETERCTFGKIWL